MSESELGVTLHLVTAGTAYLLEHVDEDVFDNPLDPELLTRFLANPMNQLVVGLVEDATDAAGDGTVIAMASAISYVHPDKPLQLFVNEVGVADAYRRQGIGRGLVDLLLARGERIGCTEAWVATEVSNAAARALYTSTGGVEDEELAVVYTYELSPEG